MNLLLGLLLSLSATFNSSAFHPLHVSVCEINHNAEKEWLEVTIKIFADDFQDVLEERTGIITHIGLPNEDVKTNDFIFDYLQEKIQININGEPREIKFSGKEVEDVSTWCYLYVPNVSEIKSIEVSNSVMVHWFNDQINVTHIDCNDKLKSTFFSKDRTKEKFVYK
ncbi:MAG: DUF6702 family protein [Chitinophagales bacterium]